MSNSFYNKKDAEKFSKCNKLISRGSNGSSSDKYMKEGFDNIPLDMINVREYSKSDFVGISVNGNRGNRLKFDEELVLLAIKAGARIVKDNTYNASRQFNIGERELSKFLEDNGYEMYVDHDKGSAWRPKKG